MTRRTRIGLVVALLALPMVLCGAGGWWLLRTEGGARWALDQAVRAAGGALTVERAAGTLTDGLRLDDVRLVSDAANARIGRVELQVGLSLSPTAVIVRSLSVERLDVTYVHGEPKSRDEGASGFRAESLRLPFAVVLERASVTGIRVVDDQGSLLLELERAELSGELGESVENMRVRAVSGESTVSLEGRFAAGGGWQHRLAANGTLGAPHVAGPPLQIEARVEGDHDRTSLDVTVQPIGLHVTGAIGSVFGVPVLDLVFTLAEWPQEWAAPGIGLAGISGTLSGPMNDYRIEAQARARAWGWQDLAVELAGQGGFDGVRVDSLAVMGHGLEALAVGSLAWSPEAAVQAKLELARADLHVAWPAWPEQAALAGEVEVAWHGVALQVRGLQARIVETGTRVEGFGVYDPAVNEVRGELEWQAFQWPPLDQNPMVRSARGTMDVSGAPGAWLVRGAMEVEMPGYPAGHVEWDGRGGLGAMELDIHRGDVLGGQVAGEARVEWQPVASWSASLTAARVDPATVFPGWPGRLDGQLRMEHEPARGRFLVDIARLGGTLRDQPVSGQGGMLMEGGRVRFSDVRLDGPESSLRLDGDPWDGRGVTFSVNTRRPGILAELLGGNVNGGGRVSLARPVSVDDLNLSASEWSRGGLSVEALHLESSPTQGTRGSSVRIEAEGLRIGDTDIEWAAADLKGDRDAQHGYFEIHDGRWAARTEWSGRLVDTSRALEDGWSGTIEALSVDADGRQLAVLRNPAELRVSRSSLEFTGACFDMAGQGGLCAETRLGSDGALSFSGELDRVPVSLSGLLFEHGLELTHTLTGRIAWRHSPGESPSGEAALRLSAGQFGESGSEDPMVSTDEGFLGFRLERGDLSSGHVELGFAGAGDLSMDFSMQGVALDGTGRIDGTARVNLEDLSVLQDIFPGLQGLQGSLASELQFGGVTRDPVVDGFVVLTGGGFSIPYLGIIATEMRARGTVSGSDRLDVRGGLRVGEGEGRFQLTADFSDWLSPVFRGQLAGESLRVVDVPGLRLDASPDVALASSERGWEISGSVHVPWARIEPVTSIVGKVTQSDDVTVVRGDLPDMAGASGNGRVPLRGSLHVSIGEDVRFETDLAWARLGGSVDLAWEGQQTPRADGRILVNGEVTAYGPVLRMRDGQVRFTGNAVTNPVLDIEAERDVFGNTQVHTAGVRISGTAREPEIEAYTDPRTHSERAWALLITGSDFDYSQGVGAFDVGTYIAPRLYISYGIGLFDSENVLSARWDLKQGFGIKATSGRRESGVDISYTRED